MFGQRDQLLNYGMTFLEITLCLADCVSPEFRGRLTLLTDWIVVYTAAETCVGDVQIV